MAESPGERELVDALRDMIGDEAGRAVAAKAAALRQELRTPDHPRRRVWDYIAALDSPEERRWRAWLRQRSECLASVAGELAEGLGEPSYMADLAAFRVAERRALAVDLTQPEAVSDGERLASIEAAYRVKKERREAAEAAAVRELRELWERVCELQQLAERHAAARALRVKPGPRADVIRDCVVLEVTGALARAGVPVGTGERSPAVLALEAVLRWYPLPGEARRLLRDLKKSRVWPVLTGFHPPAAGG
jgi:hypothetical protein